MSKHTRGEWESIGAAICVDDLDIARVYQPTGMDVHEFYSNARLIAAAPGLLEAMTKKVQDAEQRMFEDWLEFNSPSGDHEAVQRQWLESNDYRGFIGEWREQLDAIAKATGEA